MNATEEKRALSFLDEFNRCYDAVLRRIEFRFLPTQRFGEVLLTLSVQRPQRENGAKEWVNVRLAIKEVEEFRFQESKKETCRVLSSGIQIGFFNGVMFFDLAPYSLEPAGIDDYRRSAFYIAGRSFSWKTEEYSEAPGKRGRKVTQL